MNADGMAESSNIQQIDYWNGPSGRTWATYRDAYDAQLQRHLDLVLESAAPQPGERALDVGCGTGTLAVAVARMVGPEGAVTALDVSVPLLEEADRRVAAAGVGNVTLIEADAASARFPVPHDLLVSRFGVMFFADPTAAFANLLAAVRPGGRMTFVCWQDRDRNPWAALPVEVVSDLVEVPGLISGAPGPFAFADAPRVRRLLTDAGWDDVRVESSEGELCPGGPGSVEQLARFTVEGGILRSLFVDAPSELKQAAVDRLVTALAPHHDGTELRFPDAAWLVTARHPRG